LFETAAGNHDALVAFLQRLAAQTVILGTEQIDCPLGMDEIQ
jgi:hypothetical protein